MGVEIITGIPASRARVALFDFDGTLSLIRSGWFDVMVPMMVEVLASLGTGEPQESLDQTVREFVYRLTGKQTIYQMIELARQVELRGGSPEDPLVYKRRYLERLHARIRHRLEELGSGAAPPERYLVPGSRALLELLRSRGLRLYLASGTDQEFVRREAELLRLTEYFDGGIFGALDNYKSFSKKILIESIIGRSECSGHELLGFGDGYVEIENVKTAGGVAVGVATDEPACQQPDEWKRKRMLSVGADYIIPNYLCLDELQRLLFPESSGRSD